VLPDCYRRCCFTRSAVLSVLLTTGLSLSHLAAQDGVPAGTVTEGVRLTLETTHLGYTFVGDAGIRYFVTQVHVENLSDEPLTVPIADVALLVDGTEFQPDIRHPKLTGYDFRVRGKSYRFRDLEQTEILSVAAGSTGSAWVVFTGLPEPARVPKLELQFEIRGASHSLDVTGLSAEQLGLEVERIGPRQVLGLLKVNGTLDSINVGLLVETVNQFSADGVTRIVVGFGDDAAEPDEPLGSWLRQTAEGVQTSRTYAMFPAVLSTAREFHVGGMPGTASPAGQHLHSTIADAVREALASAFRGLTPSEIAREVEEGHPLVQAAALAGGGGMLSSEFLPLILDRARSEDKNLRRAAFVALGHFGDKEAIEFLIQQAQSDDASVAGLALECLAASRFPQATEALETLLTGALSVPPAQIVQILSKYPRRQWADHLYQMVEGPESEIDAKTHQEIVLALGRIGHPQLTQLLASALRNSDAGVRQAAFGLLLNRQDPESSQLALEHAMEHLSHSPPTMQMLQLFDRVRDPRVPPLLMRFLKDEIPDRAAVINTLARIGPADIDEQLAAVFDELRPNEQAVVLSNLTLLRSPRLMNLAGESLAAEHESVFSSAVRALGLLADEAAIERLAARLAQEKDIDRVESLSKALEEIGLPAAVSALEAAKNTGDSDKRTVIVRRLRSLQLKSPGGQHLRRAERYVQENDHKKAVEHYSAAIERDGELAPAYSGRGHCHLKLEDYEKAEADFRRGRELDPDDGLAVAGLGIALALSGKTEEAIQTVEEARDRFEKDLLFSYNAACVYGRILEQMGESATPGQQEQIRRYQTAALADLQRSIEMGFDDLAWMKSDPDLAPLRGLKEFEELGRNPTLQDPEPRQRPRQPPAAQPGEE
jgi:HEAT repeat protein